MAGEDLERLDTTVKALRRRIEEVALEQTERTRDLRLAVLGGALGAGLLALTATTWTSGYDPHDEISNSVTLWGLAGGGWQAAVTLALSGVHGTQAGELRGR